MINNFPQTVWFRSYLVQYRVWSRNTRCSTTEAVLDRLFINY